MLLPLLAAYMRLTSWGMLSHRLRLLGLLRLLRLTNLRALQRGKSWSHICAGTTLWMLLNCLDVTVRCLACTCAVWGTVPKH